MRDIPHDKILGVLSALSLARAEMGLQVPVLRALADGCHLHRARFFRYLADSGFLDDSVGDFVDWYRTTVDQQRDQKVGGKSRA